MTTKTCTKCSKTLPLTEFHKDSGKKDGHRNDCKTCSGKRARKHYSENRDKAKDFNLKRYYGISLSQYEDLLKAQHGCCAICGGNNPLGKGSWHVDHCHETGKVRGLLCHHCNVGIGHFTDDVSKLQQAIAYLTKHKTDNHGNN